jgi:hypothetical protein
MRINTTLEFPPLETVTSPTVTTKAAGHYMNRKDQTMRSWACLENGPILPVRINGRLHWRVSDIKTLLEGGDDHA